jgi:hypothetical protein
MTSGSLCILVLFLVTMLELESRILAHFGFIMFMRMVGAAFGHMATVATLVGVVFKDVQKQFGIRIDPDRRIKRVAKS